MHAALLTLGLVSLFVGGLSWLAAIWVKRIARRRLEEQDARVMASMRHFP